MQHTLEPLIPAGDITERINAMAGEIREKCGEHVLLVALLRGSFMFLADLARALHRQGVRAEVDFLGLSSYGAGMETSGRIEIYLDTRLEIKRKTVVVVDDILESGLTPEFACSLMSTRHAEHIYTAVLLEKPGNRLVDIAADFVGFTIPNAFVVGFGLDYAHQYRELPYVARLVDGE